MLGRCGYSSSAAPRGSGGSPRRRHATLVTTSPAWRAACPARCPDGVAFVAADRDTDDAYSAVTGNGVGPGRRRRSPTRSGPQGVAALEPVAAAYVFVSTASVYADHATPGQDESGPLLEPLDGDVMTSMETYGEAKVACERHVLERVRAAALAGRARRTARRARRQLRPQRVLAAAVRAARRRDGSVLVPRQPDAPVSCSTRGTSRDG